MQGSLVRLRAYEKSDVDALLRWFSDEEVTSLLGPWDYPVTRAAQERYFERASEPDSELKAFAIETLDGRLIGDGGLRSINWTSRKAEVFITIGEKQFWGKGYGTDTVALLIRLAFERMNLNRLWLTVLASNKRAIRCYAKLGFRREGLLRQESYVNGAYEDVIAMGLLRSEFGPPEAA